MAADRERDRLRVAVFGVGSLGQHHARIYAALPDAELVGVYDIDRDRAAEIAERSGTRAFDSVAELAAQAEAASIAIPTDRHLELATVLLESGLHLMVEKPIASSTKPMANSAMPPPPARMCCALRSRSRNSPR